VPTYAEYKRSLYPDNRPNWLARILNRGWAWVHASGIAPNWMLTLEVRGRTSGKIITFPLVVTPIEDQRYLVSMLGNDAQWVKNVRAASGKAYIRCGKRTEVRLEDVPAQQRPPILKKYLQRAPGARPHIPVNKDAPLVEFEKVAADYPVFRIIPVS